MCYPVALTLAGAVIQGVGGAMQAKNNAASYSAQSAMDERQAALERENGAYQAARLTEQGKKAVGGVITGYAANGINPSTGTAKTVAIQSGESAALDVAAVRYGAQVASDNATNSARGNAFNARSANAAAPFAFFAPIVGALGQVGTRLQGVFGSGSAAPATPGAGATYIPGYGYGGLY